MRILCYGDSNTYGYDPRSCLGGRYPESVRWTALLKEEGLEIVSDGVNGRSIPRQDWEIEAAVRAVRQADPEILAIMLGTNDLLQRSDLSAMICSKRMERFLTALLRSAPADLAVLLVAPPPVEPVRESHRLADCYEALARHLNISFADAGKWGVELAFDGVHFSGEGHRAFAEGMLEALMSTPIRNCKKTPKKFCSFSAGGNKIKRFLAEEEY